MSGVGSSSKSCSSSSSSCGVTGSRKRRSWHDVARGSMVAATCCYLIGSVFADTLSASQANNYVVELDLDAEPADATDHGVEVRMGHENVQCTIPSVSGGTANLDEERKHLAQAKILSAKDRCWQWRQDYWHYEVCVNKHIRQFKPGENMEFILGKWDEQISLPGNGSLISNYVNGTQGRASVLEFFCSPWNLFEIVLVEERPLNYHVKIPLPAACVWRGNQGHGTAEGRDPLPVSALLSDLSQNCINKTEGWWTYQYCHPHTLRQYHINANNEISEPVIMMGSKLSGKALKAFQVAHPEKYLTEEEMKAARNLPVDVSLTTRSAMNLTSNSRVSQNILTNQLEDGSVCHETGKNRTTRMIYECPPNWKDRPPFAVTNVVEIAMCVYQVTLQTHTACGHPKLLPPRARGQETIKCTKVKPDGAPPRDLRPTDTIPVPDPEREGAKLTTPSATTTVHPEL